MLCKCETIYLENSVVKGYFGKEREMEGMIPRTPLTPHLFIEVGSLT